MVIIYQFFNILGFIKFMIAIIGLPEEGQLWCQKRSLTNFLLIVNNKTKIKKAKNTPNFVVAVYCSYF